MSEVNAAAQFRSVLLNALSEQYAARQPRCRPVIVPSRQGQTPWVDARVQLNELVSSGERLLLCIEVVQKVTGIRIPKFKVHILVYPFHWQDRGDRRKKLDRICPEREVRPVTAGLFDADASPGRDRDFGNVSAEQWRLPLPSRRGSERVEYGQPAPPILILRGERPLRLHATHFI